MNRANLGLLAAIVASAGLHVVVLGLVPQGENNAGAPNLSRVVVGTSEALFGSDMAPNLSFSVAPPVQTALVALPGEVAKAMPIPGSAYPEEPARHDLPTVASVEADAAVDVPAPLPSLSSAPLSVSREVADVLAKPRDPEGVDALYAALVMPASQANAQLPEMDAFKALYVDPTMLAASLASDAAPSAPAPAMKALATGRSAGFADPASASNTDMPQDMAFVASTMLAAAFAGEEISTLAPRFADQAVAGDAQGFVGAPIPHANVDAHIARGAPASRPTFPESPAAVFALAPDRAATAAPNSLISFMGGNAPHSAIATPSATAIEAPSPTTSSDPAAVAVRRTATSQDGNRQHGSAALAPGANIGHVAPAPLDLAGAQVALALGIDARYRPITAAPASGSSQPAASLAEQATSAEAVAVTGQATRGAEIVLSAPVRTAEGTVVAGSTATVATTALSPAAPAAGTATSGAIPTLPSVDRLAATTTPAPTYADTEPQTVDQAQAERVAGIAPHPLTGAEPLREIRPDRNQIMPVRPLTAFDLYKQALRSALDDAVAAEGGRAARGTVVFALALAGNGALRSAEIVRSSGDPELDAVALRILREAAPFLRVPDELGSSGMALHLTYAFPGELGT